MNIKFNIEYLPYLRKNVRITSEYEKHAQLILENKLLLHSNLEILQFTNDYEWDYQHKQSAQTYQVYIQSLLYVNPLLKMYELTQDEIYYQKAEEIITSWLNYQDNTSNIMVWKEHPVSNRVLTFLYFLSLKETEQSLYNKVISSIVDHLDYLVDPKNYIPTNHGLMMDKAILVSSLFIDDDKVRERYTETAKDRIEKLIFRDYSYKGVHLENSPEYHIMVTNKLKKLIEILKLLYTTLDYRVINIMNKANMYLSYIINSNGELPLIGDTSYRILNVKKAYSDFLDYEAGICVFNSERDQSTLIFNAGFNNSGHKQFDDLSFIFSRNKSNIFIDGGKYSYDKSSKMVKYIRSLFAHNSFTTRKLSYSTSNVDVARIINTEITDDYKYVSGQISLNDKVLKRHLILLNDGSIVLLDVGKSDTDEEWVQNFLLDDKLSVEDLKNNSLQLSTEVDKYKLQFNNDTQNILYGENQNACYSMYFDKLIDTHRIENIFFGFECELLTIISANSHIDYEVSYSENNIRIITENTKYNINLFS